MSYILLFCLSITLFSFFSSSFLTFLFSSISPLPPSFLSESYLSAVSEITQFREEVRGEDFGRGGRGEGHLQISSINHCTHSNVTNILQLEETRRSSPPSISLTPHDHRFISPCLKANTHTLSRFNTHTSTHITRERKTRATSADGHVHAFIMHAVTQDSGYSPRDLQP